MAITVSDSGGGKFEPAPEGVHPCVCVDVVDLGPMQVTWQGDTKTQHKVRLVWEIDKTFKDEKTGEQRRFLVFSRLTASLHEKAALRKMLKSWRGVDFTSDELRGFDLENVIGAPGTMVVEHNQSGGNVYANVAHITKADKATAIKPAGTYVRVKDRPAKDANGSNGSAAHSASAGDGSDPSDDDLDKLFGEQAAGDSDIPF